MRQITNVPVEPLAVKAEAPRNFAAYISDSGSVRAVKSIRHRRVDWVRAGVGLVEDVYLEVGTDPKWGDLFLDPVLIFGVTWI